ncbi:hypothetical protein ACQP2F_23830 [Actinoplanes sp. CA-030573]|uniref:hypothetical protein n=1 Tax=Actinoplanes sp. CA-030573 TaxID=3239898 RepID=UPI003D8F33C7
MPTSTIKTADQPHHLTYGWQHAPDGRSVANEYLIEARDRSATVLRAVISGFLPGDDWADEFEAMQYGNALFFATLTEYLRHFPGRNLTPATQFGPPVTDWDATWTTLHQHLGLSADPQPGDRTTDGGHVYHRNPHTLGIRTAHGLHRYLRGFHGAMVTAHSHL